MPDIRTISMKRGLRPAATRLVVALALLLAWSAAWVGAAAQAWPPIDGVVVDDTGQLEASRINDAAQALEDLDVKPLVVFSRNGLGFGSDAEALAVAAAEQYGLSQDGVRDPDLFAISVILNSRQAFIVYGDRLRPVMEQRRGGGTLADEIRANYLNPNLAAGDYTDAYVESINYAAQQIDLFRNPLPTVAPPAPVVTNVDTDAIGDALIWIFLGIVVVVGLAILGPLLWRNYRRGQERAARIQTLREQLLQSRNVAADMITSLDFPADPNEQIQYRFLALALSRERPEQLTQLTQQYNTIHDSLEEAIARYTALNERTFSTEQELTQGIADYQWVQATYKNAGDFLQHLTSVGREVEGQRTAAPGEIDAAKKAIAAATDELARLAAAAPTLKLPGAEQLTSQASGRLSSAVSALQASPPLPLRAHDEARNARSLAESNLQAVRELSQTQARFAQEQNRLAAMRREGFQLTRANDDFQAAQEALNRAAGMLQAGRGEAFAQATAGALQAVQKAADSVNSEIAQHAANEKALAALEAAGEQLRTYIQQGAQAFDQVDEYAPSSWQDIQGNGTEAQKRADLAYQLWQRATQLNRAAAEGEQDFTEAAADIEEATGLVAEARKLVDAIIERLDHLKKSQAIAKEEIAAAEKDIRTGRDYLRQVNPDVTPRPDEMLEQAARKLAEAQQEVAQPRPDWIKVVEIARGANDMADRALADARSQAEAMEARRLKVQTTSEQALASLSRLRNFVQVHAADIHPSINQAVAEADRAFNSAQESLQPLRSGGLEDVSRARALDAAAASYAGAQKVADEAYQRAYEQFQVMEKLRKEAANSIELARRSIEEAREYIYNNQHVLSNTSLDYLHEAINLLPKWRDNADAPALRSMQAKASEANGRAETAIRVASSEIEEHNDRLRAREEADNAAEMAVLMGVLGAALSAGGGRRRGGGSWSGGWGRSGGGGIFGGGGGGGGGIFGGGGSSGGLFGGGGSSGGGWGGGGGSGGSWGGGGSSGGGW